MKPLAAREGGTPAGAISIGDALREVGVVETPTGRERAGDVSVAVAAALRASVDWLTDGGSSPRPPRISNHDGVLELTFDSVLSTALAPAADVLESADGNLGPVGDGSGAWRLRAPVMAERDLFLLVEQGALRLALPWHAVVKVRLVPTDGIDGFVSRNGWAVIAPFAEPVEHLPERPIIVVALGLRRAALVADRLVWRMTGAPAEPPNGSPAEGLRRTVRTDSGDVYWLVEPRWVLRDVAPMALPEDATPTATAAQEAPIPRDPIPMPARFEDVAPETRHEPVLDAPRVLEIDSIESLGLHGFESAPAPAPEPEPMPEPIPESPSVLSADWVEPLRFEPEVPPSVPVEAKVVVAPIASPQSPSSEAVVQSPRPERSALVAEDSIIARVFLTRLLEQQGYRVHGVATAIELRSALARGGYSIVFADVELPDGRGVELLRPLAVEAFGAGVPLVALVRDAADSDTARAAGVGHHLRKPYERESLDRLLLRLQQLSGR